MIYYQDSTNVIHNGDCIEVLKTLDDNSIDLTVTSPPYFAFKDYGNDEGNIENFINYKEYLNYLNTFLIELFRVTKEDGRVCIVIDDKHTNKKTTGFNICHSTHARMTVFGEDAGFEYKDLIIWYKIRSGRASGGSRYLLGSYPFPCNIPFISQFEYILIFRKDGKARKQFKLEEDIKASKLDFGDFKLAAESLWKVTKEQNREHPAPFPVEIPKRLIKLFSFVNDIILDPFAGSGTTAVAAKQLHRNFIGIELNKSYCDLSKNRILNTPPVLF